MNMNQDSYYSEMFSAPYILFYQFNNDHTFGNKMYCLFHVKLNISSQQCSKSYGTNSMATNEKLSFGNM